MYNLNEDQIASLENFIGKLEDSMIKSHIEKWFAEIEPTNRVTGEQMEKFVSFSTHLPKEVQNFPQSFSSAVKNTPEAEKQGAEADKELVNLTQIADDSISDVPDVDAPDDEEDTLHTLGKVKKQKAVSKKSTSKSASSASSKQPQKTDAQKKDEDDIIKRNKQVDEKPLAQKPIVIVQKGK